jgi:hypothetical protein
MRLFIFKFSVGVDTVRVSVDGEGVVSRVLGCVGVHQEEGFEERNCGWKMFNTLKNANHFMENKEVKNY